MLDRINVEPLTCYDTYTNLSDHPDPHLHRIKNTFNELPMYVTYISWEDKTLVL